jgi:thiamine-monophosphate kinase
LRRLERFAPPQQWADDAAVLQEQSGRQLVVNTDVLVEGIHFSDTTIGPLDLGWRAAAANLSDLAAMGCDQVVGLTVGLMLPAETPWPWVEGVYLGLSAALERFGGVLLGGDCSGGSQRSLAITALGHVGPGVIRRGDGRPGDRLVSTGPHGLSRLGLALLLQELPASRCTAAAAAAAIEAHRRPQPRFDAVAALERSRPADQAWRVGGTDSSDGLQAAVVAIATASGCRARLERRHLPVPPQLTGLNQAETWCLGGGEDFELVLALDADWAEALVQVLPGASLIGWLDHTEADGEAGSLCWHEGGEPSASTGFTHFQLRATSSARSTTR